MRYFLFLFEILIKISFMYESLNKLFTACGIPPPRYEENHTTTCERNKRYSVGDQIVYHCERNYVKVGGSAESRCTTQGTWTTPTLRCKGNTFHIWYPLCWFRLGGREHPVYYISRGIFIMQGNFDQYTGCLPFPFYIFYSWPCAMHHKLNHHHDIHLFFFIKERLLRFEAALTSLVILMILVIGYKQAIHQENACSFLYPYI